MQDSDYANYHIGADLDITRFWESAAGISFSFAMPNMVTQAMNEAEALWYRIDGENMILHARLQNQLDRF